MFIPQTPEIVTISVEVTPVRWGWRAVQGNQILGSESGSFDRPQSQSMARRFALLKSQRFNLDYPNTKTRLRFIGGGA
jgi:hypothetical protein